MFGHFLMRLVLDPINVLPVFQRADVAEKLDDRPCAGRVLRCNDVERGTYKRYITIVICHSLPVTV